MLRPDPIRRLLSALGRVAPLLGFGVLWHLFSHSGLVDPAFLPPPAAVGRALVDLLSGNEIRDNLLITLVRALVGLVLGAVAGV